MMTMAPQRKINILKSDLPETRDTATELTGHLHTRESSFHSKDAGTKVDLTKSATIDRTSNVCARELKKEMRSSFSVTDYPIPSMTQ